MDMVGTFSTDASRPVESPANLAPGLVQGKCCECGRVGVMRRVGTHGSVLCLTCSERKAGPSRGRGR